MDAILDKKRQYIEEVTQDLQQGLSHSIKQSLCAIEINALIADCASLFDLIAQIDDECFSHPDRLTEEEWETYWHDTETFLSHLLTPANVLIQVGEQLVAQGEELPALEHLKERATEAWKSLNWPEDYATTEKYQALARQAELDYLSGNTEEGGWDVPEDEIAPQ